MPRSPELPAGCLVALPIDDERCAAGQILVPGVKFYIGIDPEGRSSVEESDLLNLRLFAWTTDGEIYRKSWKLIGQRPVPEQFPRPDYKFEQEGETLVETFDGSVIRPRDAPRQTRSARAPFPVRLTWRISGRARPAHRPARHAPVRYASNPAAPAPPCSVRER